MVWKNNKVGQEDSERRGQGQNRKNGRHHEILKRVEGRLHREDDLNKEKKEVMYELLGNPQEEVANRKQPKAGNFRGIRLKSGRGEGRE